MLHPVALAIGRTGNGVTDPEDGFSALVPAEYSDQQPMGLGNLRLLRQSFPVRFNPIVPKSVLELLRVVNVFPEFQTMSRSDLVFAIGKDGWWAMPTFDRCVQAFAYRSSTIAEGLVLWGQSKGVLIRAPNTDDNWQAINVILSSLKIEAGACDWK